MVYTIDKEMLVLENPSNIAGEGRRWRKKRNTIVFTFVIMVILLSICFSLWFLTMGRRHNGYNPYVNISEQFTSPVFDTTSRSSFCSIDRDLRFDCYPNVQATEEQCISVGCCYQNEENEYSRTDGIYYPSLKIPQCYYPADYVGYRLKDIPIIDQRQGVQIKAQLERVLRSSFPNDITLLNLHIKSIDENSVQIKIYDARNSRHEAPLNENITYKNVAEDKLRYAVHLHPNGTLSIQRKSSNVVIFQTNLQQLIFADQFLQLSTLLPSPYIYGLGEHYDHLLKNVNWTRTPLFNRDNWPKKDVLLYGTHPFYLLLEDDRNSHGVFFLNSNSMDFTLQPLPALTFRTIGGIIDFFIFLGPTPGEVVGQYTQLVSRPFMPPYWSLGFHLCRYEYNSLNETIKVWQRNKDAGIPFDTQWNDIDYMKDHNDFTYDPVFFKGLPEFVKRLHDEGMHYVMIIDPGITNTEKPGSYAPFDEGLKMNVFVRNSSGDLFIGKVWNPISTVFPDFSHPNASEYWIKQFQKFHEVVPFDGAWIDMNEPANFYDGQVDGCPNTTWDNPPYVPGGLEPLRVHTLCMSAKHYNSLHYNEHSLYAYREAIATYFAMSNLTSNKKRPFVISRASFAGQGRWNGHWTGDIGSNWEDLRYSVYDLLKFSLYGIPMMGSDICGFRDDTTIELCARWSAVGAFYPFSRNHNDKGQKDQDPAWLGGIVLAVAKNTLTTRYKLLPYLYYLFHRSHAYGETVARPLYFEFVDDPKTYSIDEQFLWGPSLMIMPALYEGMKQVEVYFPQDIWYDYYTGRKLDVGGRKVKLDAPLESINLALRGGYVIPHQHSNTTTTESRKNRFYLIAGLDKNNEASGELYWDDGETLGSFENNLYNLIVFKLQQNVFTSNVSYSGYPGKMDLDYVKVCGLASQPKDVYYGDKKVDFTFDKYNCLKVVLNISLLENFVMRWK